MLIEEAIFVFSEVKPCFSRSSLHQHLFLINLSKKVTPLEAINLQFRNFIESVENIN